MSGRRIILGAPSLPAMEEDGGAAGADAGGLPSLHPHRFHVDVNFKTTPVEDEVFDVVRAAAQELARATGEDAIDIRVAGGWVRDKLLGTPSDDIDFAFSEVSGLSFARHVNTVLRARGEPTTDLDSRSVRNAEQSAHLETVCIGIAGLEIDMNALRREEYLPASRIPEITPGTLLDDAERRDLTINALFYKLGRTPEEDSIEDPTGKGLRDMRAGVVRTNIDPVQSFTDDPLRMLRFVRYASRYGFRMTPDARAVFDCASVRRQFRSLVSRQLIMRELFKMLHQEERVDAIVQLDSVGRDMGEDEGSADDDYVTVPGGSFLNDVLPMHLMLKQLLKVPVEESYDPTLVPKTTAFLKAWDELAATKDVRFSTLAHDVATVSVYAAASVDPHLAKQPLPTLPLFRAAAHDPRAPTAAARKKLDKQRSALLKKMELFLTEHLPLSTTRDSRLFRHAVRGALDLAAALRQVKELGPNAVKALDAEQREDLKIALAAWLQAYLDVDFNDCKVGAEEVLSLRIVSAPTEHATNVPWRAVLLMAVCLVYPGMSAPELNAHFVEYEAVFQRAQLEAIAAPLPLLNGGAVRDALAEALGRPLAPGPIISLLVAKVFAFQVHHSVVLVEGQPGVGAAASPGAGAGAVPVAANGDVPAAADAPAAADTPAAGSGGAGGSPSLAQLQFTEAVTKEMCIKFLMEDADVQAELAAAAARAAGGPSKGKGGKKKKKQHPKTVE